MPGCQPLVGERPNGPQMIADNAENPGIGAVEAVWIPVPYNRNRRAQHFRAGNGFASFQGSVTSSLYFISSDFSNTVQYKSVVGPKQDDLADGQWLAGIVGLDFNDFAIADRRVHAVAAGAETAGQPLR